MFDGHIQDRLTAYLDGEMPENERALADTHLRQCGLCREDMARVRDVVSVLERMPLVAAPAGLWQAIEAAVDTPSRPRTSPMWRYVAAAAVVLTIACAAWWKHLQTPTWQVTRLTESQSITENVRTGRLIETGNSSSAYIRVADIGSVQVGPGTRVRLVETGSRGHRLALENGTLSAKISAPPRLFFVETPAATAIDLGCEYTLQCDRAGTGLLRVTAGWVALERQGRESLVPAGASCRMRATQGPGTPWFDDAGETLISALDAFDTSRNGLDTILAVARPRDTLTLWHLLSQVDAGDRARVYDRVAALAPPPTGVTREKVLSLNAEAMTLWKNELAWIW
jgi:hypothetical protein